MGERPELQLCFLETVFHRDPIQAVLTKVRVCAVSIYVMAISLKSIADAFKVFGKPLLNFKRFQPMPVLCLQELDGNVARVEIFFFSYT